MKIIGCSEYRNDGVGTLASAVAGISFTAHQLNVYFFLSSLCRFITVFITNGSAENLPAYCFWYRHGCLIKGREP
ncbi:MAG TPA: hypothetical protein VFM99_10350 [Chitinophagales bacterium]|nr:hypothetical protein [Chitinophagales bacterium]